MLTVALPHDDGTDPFADIDESESLQGLIDVTLPLGQSCSAAEYTALSSLMDTVSSAHQQANHNN